MTVKREGICNSLHFAGGFQVGITMFYLKDSGSVLITAYAFGMAIATVTVLLCGRFVVLSRKNWLQTMFERNIGFKSKAQRLRTC